MSVTGSEASVFNAIDISSLPKPAILEGLDFEALLAAFKDELLARVDPEEAPNVAAVLALESEPLAKLTEVAAYRDLLQRARYNDEARALMLAFATGADLDHLGVTYFRGERRLVVIEAKPHARPPRAAVMESDTAFRGRLALKNESYSVAGPTGAYLFHALSAAGTVKDVSVTSPRPGTTLVTVLGTEGDGTPDEATLAAVSARLNTDTIRPLCEEVIVQAAEIVPYAIDIRLHHYAGPDVSLVRAAAEDALAAFATKHHRCGHDITLSAIYAAAHQPGVQRVIIDSPAADLVVGYVSAPWCTSILVTMVGEAL